MEKENKKEGGGVRFLYHTFVGRLFLGLITRRFISKTVGAFLSSGLSRPRIKRFIKKNSIDMSGCEKETFSSFNDFFTRKLKDGQRPFDASPDALVSPCDGRLSVYPVTDGTVMPIKQSTYTVKSLLRNDELAKKYENGLCLVFRLCVDDYHRYAYFDGAKKGENVFIPGVLHTVRPIALEKYPVFCENCREYTVMETDGFGTATQIEVGALLVGKIKNLDGACRVERGAEKGTFLFGGSTIVLLLEKDRAVLDERFEMNSGNEIRVRMGEKIGTKAKSQ